MSQMDKSITIFVMVIVFLATFVVATSIKYQINNTNNQVTQQIEKLDKRVTKLEQIIINKSDRFSSPVDCTKCIDCYNGKKKAMKYQTIK